MLTPAPPLARPGPSAMSSSTAGTWTSSQTLTAKTRTTSTSSTSSAASSRQTAVTRTTSPARRNVPSQKLTWVTRSITPSRLPLHPVLQQRLLLCLPIRPSRWRQRRWLQLRCLGDVCLSPRICWREIAGRFAGEHQGEHRGRRWREVLSQSVGAHVIRG